MEYVENIPLLQEQMIYLMTSSHLAVCYQGYLILKYDDDFLWINKISHAAFWFWWAIN